MASRIVNLVVAVAFFSPLIVWLRLRMPSVVEKKKARSEFLRMGKIAGESSERIADEGVDWMDLVVLVFLFVVGLAFMVNAF